MIDILFSKYTISIAFIVFFLSIAFFIIMLILKVLDESNWETNYWFTAFKKILYPTPLILLFILWIFLVFLAKTLVEIHILLKIENPLLFDNITIFSNINPYGIIISLSIILFSFLYFSIWQYWKAKELRIENQNKIALLHWFQAINSNIWITNKEIFHQNISDVVFTKAYRDKNSQNLPIDKIIDLIKLTK
jgi:hypothetical protein